MVHTTPTASNSAEMVRPATRTIRSVRQTTRLSHVTLTMTHCDLLASHYIAHITRTNSQGSRLDLNSMSDSVDLHYNVSLSFIFHLIPREELICSCALVCKLWRDVILNTPRLVEQEWSHAVFDLMRGSFGRSSCWNAPITIMRKLS